MRIKKRSSVIFVLYMAMNMAGEESAPFDMSVLYPLDMHGWFGPANQDWLRYFIQTI